MVLGRIGVTFVLVRIGVYLVCVGVAVSDLF